jgi:hypothetical protein
VDISTYLTRNTTFGSDDDLGTINSTALQPLSNYTRYSLPYVSISNKDHQDPEDFITVTTTAFMVAAALTDPSSTISFQKLNTMISAVGTIKPDSSYKGAYWNETLMAATECALYICTNAYVSKVEHGQLSEDVVGSWSVRKLGSYAAISWPDDMEATRYSSWLNDSLYPHNPGPYVEIEGILFDRKRHDLQLQIPPEQAYEKGLPENTTLLFNISQQTTCSAAYAISAQLFGGGPVIWPPAYKPASFSPVMAQVLYDTAVEDIPALFDNIARSLTAWMRDSSNETKVGMQHDWVVHLQVHWAYLALPLLTVVGGCIYTLFSILDTRNMRLPPWKSDLLATFIHGVDTETRAQLSLAERHDGHVRRSAKTMNVILEETGHGLELKRCCNGDGSQVDIGSGST